MKKLLFLLLIFSLSLFVFSAPVLYINEFRYDTPGTDTNCFVEIKGIPGTSLDSVKLLGINGNGGAVTSTISLSGCTIPSDSYFVIAQSTNVPNYDLVTALVDFQNGPCDNIILRFDSLGSYTTIDAVCYGLPSGTDTVFRGEVWPTYDPTPSTSYTAILARYNDPFLSDFNNNYLDYAHYNVKTPGTANKPLKPVTIVQIQQSPDSFSLYKDSTVFIIDTCIVTAVFGGQYYVTSTTGPKEWDGVNVYGDIVNYTYKVGDTINFIHCFVTEYNNKTEIVFPGTVLYNSGDGTSPNPYSVSLSQIGESFEGVLIKVGPVDVLTAPDSITGEWIVSDGVDSLIIDNLATYTVPSVGSKVFITGILDYSGNYKLQPRKNNDIQYVSFYNLSGIVGLDDTLDCSGISVILYNNDVNDTIVTDSTGNYDFGSIQEGTYTLLFKKTYYETDSMELVLSQDTIISVVLPRSKGEISGTINLSDNPSDLSNSVVYLNSADPYLLTLSLIDTTGTDGKYLFADLPFGYNFKLKFEHTGYASDSFEIFLDDYTKTYDLTLTKLTGIDEVQKVEKIVVEENGGGIFSFLYNKEVENPTNIQIYDLTGRNIVNKPVNSGKGVYKVTLDKKLSKGVYFIQITGEEKPFVKKFIIVN
uniref:T9SS type A sorting domain-containing protein n=1 Tax=candidate division WOR-3 bacterium TaxID=2052148 RepID=A0A7C3N900_UNCW3